MLGNGWLIPPLLLLVIGIQLECVNVDPLHAVDQGISSHIIANILWYYAIVRRVLGGKTQKEAMQRRHDHLKQWYKRVKHTSKIQGALTVERLRATAASLPKLKAKAYATRHVARFCLHFAREHHDPNSEDNAIDH